MQGRVAIGVMAKAPVAGRSKTRLCPPLTPVQAAAMSAAFLRDITDNLGLAGRAAPIDGWIAYAPAGSAGLFEGLLAPGTRLLLADGAVAPVPGVTGFGLCLFDAMRTMLGLGYAAACVLNSDSPSLPTAYLVRAAEALLAPGERVVLGPADDGGYYLVGAKTADPHLFADIAWSTEGVAAATRARVAERGLELVELPAWYDVDEHAALLRLGVETEGYAAPVSRAALARMGLAARLGAAAE